MKTLILFITILSSFKTQGQSEPCSKEQFLTIHRNELAEDIDSVGSQIHLNCPSWQFIPTSLLNQRLSMKSCDNQSPVTLYLYGETHDDKIDGEIEHFVEKASLNKGIYGLFEGDWNNGQARDGYYNGLDSIGGASGYLQLNLYSLYSNAINLPEHVQKSFVNNLFVTFCDFKDVWKNFDHTFEDPDSNRLAVMIDKMVEENTCWKPGEEAKELLQGSSLVKENIVLNFRDEVENNLLQNSFSGVTGEDLYRHSAQELRELEWIEFLLDITCDAKKNHLPVWMHMGKNHVQSLSCALNAMSKSSEFKSSFNIVPISQDEIPFSERKENVKQEILKIVTEELQKSGAGKPDTLIKSKSLSWPFLSFSIEPFEDFESTLDNISNRIKNEVSVGTKTEYNSSGRFFIDIDPKNYSLVEPTIK